MFHIPHELNGMVDLAKVKVSYAIEKLYNKWKFRVQKCPQ